MDILEIKKKVAEYYTKKILHYGATSQGVDWNSQESQTIRFEQLCKILPLDVTEKFSILDYGCGYGALKEFLSRKYTLFAYTGFDISLEMINEAKKLYPYSSFVNDETMLSPHDYVIASGLFNVKLSIEVLSWHNYIVDTLEKMNALACKGFAFNMLTSYSDIELMKDYLYYANPCIYFDHCKKHFSRNVALLHDYHLYEFTILIRK